jgi:hypothetical protein
MDKKDWSWLPAQMPGVAKLMAEKRAKFGNEHVNECWKRGVLMREPGWFFAAEGALMVGTPWPHDLVMSKEWPRLGTQALVMMKDPGVKHGAT